MKGDTFNTLCPMKDENDGFKNTGMKRHVLCGGSDGY